MNGQTMDRIMKLLVTYAPECHEAKPMSVQWLYKRLRNIEEAEIISSLRNLKKLGYISFEDHSGVITAIQLNASAHDYLKDLVEQHSNSTNDRSKLFTYVSLFIGILGAIAGVLSAFASMEQAKITQTQTLMLKDQHEANQPNIELHLQPGNFFPIKGQEDGYENPYRVSIRMVIINKSALPVTLTYFELYKNNSRIAFSMPGFEPKSKYILEKKQVSPSSYLETEVRFDALNFLHLPHVLGAFEAKSGNIFMLVSETGQSLLTEENSPMELNLRVYTSRRNYEHTLQINKKVGNSFIN